MAEPMKAKGTKIRSKLTFLEEEYGEEMVAEVLASLAPEDQQTLRRMLDLGWYPAELYHRLVHAIVVTVGGDAAELLDRIGKDAAERQSAGAYKVYYKSKDAVTVLRQMAPMHSMLNDPGEMEIAVRGPRRVSIVVRQPPSTPELCRIARAFYQRSVELCGFPSVSVVETRCSGRNDSFCQFNVSW